jgi:hypothetical protein
LQMCGVARTRPLPGLVNEEGERSEKVARSGTG